MSSRSTSSCSEISIDDIQTREPGVFLFFFQCIDFDLKTMEEKQKNIETSFGWPRSEEWWCVPACVCVRSKGIQNELTVELLRVHLFSFNSVFVSSLM